MADARATVALVRCSDYSREHVERAVGEVLERLGGMGRFVRPGESALLKPNLLSGKPPEAAVTTHPEVVRAVARAALDAGAVVEIGDASGLHSVDVVAARCGVAAVAEELGVPLCDLDDPVPVPRPEGARFRKLLLARKAMEADAVLNLPKVKTHQQMFLTLAVKNLFGCVVGKEKMAWHMSAGRDTETFARALVEICLAVGPRLHLADGVVGMEGAGPGSGEPRAFGFLAASADPFALDTVLTLLLGFEVESVPVLAAARAARRDGLAVGETDPEAIEVVGDSIDALRARRVKPPETARPMFLPGVFAGIARRLITVRPQIVHSACRRCGVCIEHCPAGAMKLVNHRVRIDDTACIRCFCCQELCPHEAVHARRGLLARFFSH